MPLTEQDRDRHLAYVTDLLDRIPSDFSQDQLEFVRGSTQQLIDILERFDPKSPARLDIGHGWLPLVLHLDRKLRCLYPEYQILQIKEKVGTLRFYAQLPHDYTVDNVPNYGTMKAIFYDLIYYTELRSAKICEYCGNTGTTRGGPGYQHTRCDKHQL